MWAGVKLAERGFFNGSIKFRYVKIAERFRHTEDVYAVWYVKTKSTKLNGYYHNCTYYDVGVVKYGWKNQTALVYVTRGWWWRVKSFLYKL